MALRSPVIDTMLIVYVVIIGMSKNSKKIDEYSARLIIWLHMTVFNTPTFLDAFARNMSDVPQAIIAMMPNIMPVEMSMR